jgi:phytoene synthase
MMTLIMGVRDPVVLQRACELGLAMQLTNIARDVGEDARNGRLYLPRSWMREAGIDPDVWLQNPVFSDALGSVVSRLLKTADAMYQRSIAGVAGLPRNCRAAISAARLIYCEIGREVERRGMNSINHRAVVPFSKKLLLMGQAFMAGIYSPKLNAILEPIAELQFLVEAVLPNDPHAHYEGSIEDRMIWVINLMERVERRRLQNYDAFMQPEKTAA